jgi:hypothetical protein
MSGNDVPIKEEERWFKDGVDPDVSPSIGLACTRTKVSTVDATFPTASTVS